MITAELNGGRGILPADAAASIHRIDAQIGHLVQITEAGRTRDRQLYLYTGWVRRAPGFNRALHPDNPRANHVLAPGRRGAVDSDEQTGVPWEENGWILTAWDEPWHREYFAERDQHRHNTQEDDDMFTDDDRAKLDWLMEQVGGSNARKTSAREDIDEVRREVSTLRKIVGRTLARAKKGDTIGTSIDAIRKKLGA